MNMSEGIHGALDCVMLLEIAAGTVYLGAVLLDWALDRALRCFRLQESFKDFMIDWFMKGKGRKYRREE